MVIPYIVAIIIGGTINNCRYCGRDISDKQILKMETFECPFCGCTAMKKVDVKPMGYGKVPERRKMK